MRLMYVSKDIEWNIIKTKKEEEDDDVDNDESRQWKCMGSTQAS